MAFVRIGTDGRISFLHFISGGLQGGGGLWGWEGGIEIWTIQGESLNKTKQNTNDSMQVSLETYRVLFLC